MAEGSGEKPASLRDNDEAKKQETDEVKSQVSTDTVHGIKRLKIGKKLQKPD